MNTLIIIKLVFLRKLLYHLSLIYSLSFHYVQMIFEHIIKIITFHMSYQKLQWLRVNTAVAS